MERNPAVDINGRHLLRIVAGLFAMAGVWVGGAVERLPRCVHLSILDRLRPLEAATRRLIAILAADIVVAPRKGRSAPAGAIPRGKGGGTPVFPLFDPRKRVGPPPRKTVPGHGPSARWLDSEAIAIPVRVPPKSDDLVDAGRVCRRMNAILNALNDLDRQARRLARVLASGQAKYTRVMRPGRPPGYRARPFGSLARREIDEILADCHEFALQALHAASTRAPP